jgi:Zinc finger C-x8-C-x5-C-x3-H type (and similar)
MIYNNFLIHPDYIQDFPLSSFKHLSLKEPSEVGIRKKYKTEMCRNWELGNCEFGETCAFAHGDQELRLKPNLGYNYKTKKCKQFYELGYCIYGNRCQFKHKNSSSENTSPKSTQNSSRKSSSDPIKKRLQVFIDIERKGSCYN